MGMQPVVRGCVAAYIILHLTRLMTTTNIAMDKDSSSSIFLPQRLEAVDRAREILNTARILNTDIRTIVLMGFERMPSPIPEYAAALIFIAMYLDIEPEIYNEYADYYEELIYPYLGEMPILNQIGFLVDELIHESPLLMLPGNIPQQTIHEDLIIETNYIIPQSATQPNTTNTLEDNDQVAKKNNEIEILGSNTACSCCCDCSIQ